MPVPYLKKLASKHGVSLDAAEKRWEKAKTLAAEQGHGDNYAYITGIAKKMFNEDYPGIAKMIRDLIEDIRSGKIDADEAAAVLAETVTSGSVGGFIAGGLVQGYTGTPFPTGTRDRNGIPNMPSWGNAAEQKSASNLPGRKKKHHHKKKRKHVRESTEGLSADDHQFFVGRHEAAIHFIKSELREPDIINKEELRRHLRAHQLAHGRHWASASGSSDRHRAGRNSFLYPDDTTDSDRDLMRRLNQA